MRGNSHQRYKEDPEIRALRIRTWFRAVTLASGMTPAELELEFSERRTKHIPARSCIWEKYRRGEVEPRSGRRPDGELNLVERAEARYPGTSVWLTWPLWRLIDKAPLSMAEVKSTYEGLPIDLRTLFMLPSAEATRSFWRRPLDLPRLSTDLGKLTTPDDLIAGMAVWREMEATQNHDGHAMWTNILRENIRALAWTQPVLSHLPRSILLYLAL